MSSSIINPDTLLTNDVLLQTVSSLSSSLSNNNNNNYNSSMKRTISISSLDSHDDDSQRSSQSNDYIINKINNKNDNDNDDKYMIDNLKKSNTILKKMLDRLISRDYLSDEEKQSLLQDIKAYELEELSDYIMSLHLSMSMSNNYDNDNDDKEDTIISPSKTNISPTKTRPITPGYPLIVPPIIEPNDDKEAYKKILEKPQTIAKKNKLTNEEKKLLDKAKAKKNRKLRIFQKAEEIMNEIEFQQKKEKELELKYGKKVATSTDKYAFKYSVKEMDEKITKKKAKEAIQRVRLKISAGNQEFAQGPLKPVEEKLLTSPFAAPICEQLMRNMISPKNSRK